MTCNLTILPNIKERRISLGGSHGHFSPRVAIFTLSEHFSPCVAISHLAWPFSPCMGIFTSCTPLHAKIIFFTSRGKNSPKNHEATLIPLIRYLCEPSIKCSILTQFLFGYLIEVSLTPEGPGSGILTRRYTDDFL